MLGGIPGWDIRGGADPTRADEPRIVGDRPATGQTGVGWGEFRVLRSVAELRGPRVEGEIRARARISIQRSLSHRYGVPLESRAMRRLVFLLLLPIAFSVPAFAWGEKGHVLAAEAAVRGVPPEMPLFFHKAYSRLVYLANDPDRWRGAGRSADDENPPEHFLDYEYVADLELPRGRHDFIALLYSSGRARARALAPDTAGFIVWQIAETSETLTDQFRRWRSMPDGPDRDQVEETIIFLAGTLGHYVADSANPHHATIHYNGWVGDPSRGFRNDCEAHARFESVFVTNRVELADVQPLVAAPRSRPDGFTEALALIRDSNAQVERLYALDAAGAFDYPSGSPEGKAFAAGRLALGASVLRDLWWSAWVESGKPRARRSRDE